LADWRTKHLASLITMKKWTMYILIGLAVLFVGFEAYTTVSTDSTQQQPYTVLETRNDLEIRRYPEALIATVVRPGGAYSDVSNSGFRRLAGYIFGGNEGGQKIAMTAPVHMEMGADSSRMSFVMPEELTMDSLPRPNDPDVRLQRAPAEVVAAFRFGGFANEGKIQEHSARLLELLARQGLTPIGPVRYLGYNPPWQLVGRRNEVIVTIAWPG
jgi:hypothetical protein